MTAIQHILRDPLSVYQKDNIVCNSHLSDDNHSSDDNLLTNDNKDNIVCSSSEHIACLSHLSDDNTSDESDTEVVEVEDSRVTSPVMTSSLSIVIPPSSLVPSSPNTTDFSIDRILKADFGSKLADDKTEDRADDGLDYSPKCYTGHFYNGYTRTLSPNMSPRTVSPTTSPSNISPSSSASPHSPSRAYSLQDSRLSSLSHQTFYRSPLSSAPLSSASLSSAFYLQKTQTPFYQQILSPFYNAYSRSYGVEKTTESKSVSRVKNNLQQTRTPEKKPSLQDQKLPPPTQTHTRTSPVTPTTSPESSAKSSPPSSDKEVPWPAWVYCTRYSDRPSSGKYNIQTHLMLLLLSDKRRLSDGKRSNNHFVEDSRPRRTT